eukprot:9608094-Lingulodinium_polyedra.AAC.1
MQAFIGSAGNSTEDKEIEADINLLRGLTLKEELGGLPVTRENILKAIARNNRRCLAAMRGELPIKQIQAKDPRIGKNG